MLFRSLGASIPAAQGSAGWAWLAHTGGLIRAGRPFDPTLGFPGEGPCPATGPGGETLRVTTANVTSWGGAVRNGALDQAADILLLQETRLVSDALRGAKAEAKRHQYWGLWTPAVRRGRMGAASGGLAQLSHVSRPWREIKPAEPGLHWREGRWAHSAIWAGGRHIHLFNLYGWPAGTPGRAQLQADLWLEVFAVVAGLGSAPWIVAGDWNAEPDELWPHVLCPRVGWILPGPGERQPT